MNIKNDTIFILILILVIVGLTTIFFLYEKYGLKEGFRRINIRFPKLRRFQNWWGRRNRRNSKPRYDIMAQVQVENPKAYYNVASFPDIVDDTTLKTTLKNIQAMLSKSNKRDGTEFKIHEKILWISMFTPVLLKPIQSHTYNYMLNSYPETLDAGSSGSEDQNIDNIRDKNYTNLKQIIVVAYNLSGAYSDGIDPNDSYTMQILLIVYNIFVQKLQAIVGSL